MKVINLFSKKNKKKEEKEQQAAVPNFKDFAMQIEAGDHDAAAKSLVFLLGLDEGTAKHAAVHYADKKAQGEQVQQIAQSLRSQLSEKNVNNALHTIFLCFGLQGPVALHVLFHLKTQMGVK